MTGADAARLLVLGACLATAGAWDLTRRRIPNAVNVATALLGVGVAAISGSLHTVGLALAGAALIFVLLFLAYRRRWIGGGDVKLGAALGTWLGPIGGLYAVVVGCAMSAVLAAVVLARGSAALRSEVKSNLIMACYTGRVSDTNNRSDKDHIPLGTALAAAAMLIFVVRGGAGA